MSLEKLTNNATVLRSECSGSGSGTCGGGCSNSSGSDPQNLRKKRNNQS